VPLLPGGEVTPFWNVKVTGGVGLSGVFDVSPVGSPIHGRAVKVCHPSTQFALGRTAVKLP